MTGGREAGNKALLKDEEPAKQEHTMPRQTPGLGLALPWPTCTHYKNCAHAQPVPTSGAPAFSSPSLPRRSPDTQPNLPSHHLLLNLATHGSLHSFHPPRPHRRRRRHGHEPHHHPGPGRAHPRHCPPPGARVLGHNRYPALPVPLRVRRPPIPGQPDRMGPRSSVRLQPVQLDH